MHTASPPVHADLSGSGFLVWYYGFELRAALLHSAPLTFNKAFHRPFGAAPACYGSDGTHALLVAYGNIRNAVEEESKMKSSS
jgi:hypothetical protein